MHAGAGSKAAAAAPPPPLARVPIAATAAAEEGRQALQQRLGDYLTGAVSANLVFLGDQ